MSVNTAGSKGPEIREPSQARFFRRRPFEKCVADITEIPAKDRKLYVSAVFDCYDLSVLGLAMANNMRAELCASTVQNAAAAYPLCGAVLHSDRGGQSPVRCTEGSWHTAASFRA